MRKGKITLLVVALITAFVATGLLLPGPARAGDLEPPAGPDDPASAMYTIEDIYHYLDTGVAGTKRTGGFVEPTSPPGPTGHTLNQVHDKIGERCITCTGTLSAGGRWCDKGTGTVTDMTTGLVWLQNAGCMGKMNWPDAIKKPIEELRNGNCGLTDGSIWGDWRLPTKDELYGITQGTEYVRSSDMHFFSNVQSGGCWSRTTLAFGSDSAWGVDMSMVFGGVYYNDKTVISYVWPVRPDN